MVEFDGVETVKVMRGVFDRKTYRIDETVNAYVETAANLGSHPTLTRTAAGGSKPAALRSSPRQATTASCVTASRSGKRTGCRSRCRSLPTGSWPRAGAQAWPMRRVDAPAAHDPGNRRTPPGC